MAFIWGCVCIKRSVLVIGGGIAGIQTSLDLADLGFEVYLIERTASIGGHVAQLDRLFPTLDEALEVLKPMMDALLRHPKINLLTCSEITGINGSSGSFSVRISKRPRYVDDGRCMACGKCVEACPVIVPSEFNLGLSQRKAIFIPFQGAVPRVYVIDREACLHFKEAACDACEAACPEKAVNFDQIPKEMEVEVGSIVVATGFDLYDAKGEGELGYGSYKNVITGLEFERLSSTTGPTGGKVLRPSDQREPKSVAFILCVGSRNETANPYCCRVGCAASMKQAYSLKKIYGDNVDVYICLTDLRVSGKGLEEFSQRVKGMGVTLLRGQPSEVRQLPDGSLTFDVFDLASSKLLRINADLLVLEVGLIPGKGVENLQRLLKIPVGSDGFFLEVDPKLNQVETPVKGIFLAGAAQGPKDVAEAILHARTAALAVAKQMLGLV